MNKSNKKALIYSGAGIAAVLGVGVAYYFYEKNSVKMY